MPSKTHHILPLLVFLVLLSLIHSTSARWDYSNYPDCARNIEPSSIAASDPTNCAGVNISDMVSLYNCACVDNSFMRASTAVILQACCCQDYEKFAAAHAKNCAAIDVNAPLATEQAFLQMGNATSACASEADASSEDESEALQRTSNLYGLIFGIIGAVGVIVSLCACYCVPRKGRRKSRDFHNHGTVRSSEVHHKMSTGVASIYPSLRSMLSRLLPGPCLARFVFRRVAPFLPRFSCSSFISMVVAL